MAIEPLAYFRYPMTKETEVNFRSWKCPVCSGENPNSEGGTVAHAPYDKEHIHIDGRKHPIHLFCLLSIYSHNTLCPNCRAKTDASSLIPLSQKCMLTALRLFKVISDRIPNPMAQLYAGVTCMIAGISAKKNSLILLGMVLQAHMIHRAIQAGGFPTKLAQEILYLIEEILFDMKNQIPVTEKLARLKSISSQYPEVFAWMESRNEQEIAKGLSDSLEKVKRDLIGDRLVRLWRMSAILGALYYGKKIVSRIF